jgi:uncharacterized membrane protein YdbT with pleckstrin-like domain
MTQENSFWKGSSSQWLNLGPFAVALTLEAGVLVGGAFFPLGLIGLVVPAGYFLWRYLLVRTRVFELTSERLRVTSGVINQKIDEIELYRVKDSQMVRPWWMRLTGLASIVLETSDRTMPHLTIPAIQGGVELRELLRKNVELQRDRKRVRETDFDEVGGDTLGDS